MSCSPTECPRAHVLQSLHEPGQSYRGLLCFSRRCARGRRPARKSTQRQTSVSETGPHTHHDTLPAQLLGRDVSFPRVPGQTSSLLDAQRPWGASRRVAKTKRERKARADLSRPGSRGMASGHFPSRLRPAGPSATTRALGSPSSRFIQRSREAATRPGRQQGRARAQPLPCSLSGRGSAPTRGASAGAARDPPAPSLSPPLPAGSAFLSLGFH